MPIDPAVTVRGLRKHFGDVRADDGTVRVLGGDQWTDAVALHSPLAYVPGDVTLWPTLTGGEVIDLLGLLSRRQRGTAIGWAVGLLLLGATFGSLTDAVVDMVVGNPARRRLRRRRRRARRLLHGRGGGLLRPVHRGVRRRLGAPAPRPGDLRRDGATAPLGRGRRRLLGSGLAGRRRDVPT
jgi:hypothetical protein